MRLWTAMMILMLAVLARESASAGPLEDRQLVLAAGQGNISAVEAALARGAAVDVAVTFGGDDGAKVTPLEAAVFGGSAEVLERLLAAYANPHAADYEAVSWAIRLNDAALAVPLIEALGEYGPEDPHLMLVVADRLPQARAEEVRRLFRESLAEPEAETLLAIAMIYLGGREETPDGEGYRAIVDALLAAGFELEAKTDEGRTAAGVATTRSDSSLLTYLLAKGARPPESETASAANPNRLVSLARWSDVEAVRAALDAGADPSKPDSDGNYALPEAAGRDPAMVDLLIGRGAAVDAYGPDQSRALVAAAEAGALPSITRLVAAGARIEAAPREFRDWPLRAAVRVAAAPAVELLIDLGADVNAVVEERSVLHGISRHDGFMAGKRTLNKGHYAMPTLLKAHGFKFGQAGTDTSLFNSNIERNGSDLELLEALVEAGTTVGPAAVTIAIQYENPTLLDWLIRNKVPLQSKHLITAARELPSERYLLRLLDAGVAPPTEAAERRELLDCIVRYNGPKSLARLLKAGLPIPREEHFPLLRQMVNYGRPALIRIATEQGVDPSAVDDSGYTVLHRFVIDDARAPGTQIVIRKTEIPALAALLDARLDMSKPNQWGDTVAKSAAKKAATQQRLQEIVAFSGGASLALHRAVRDNDMPSVAALLARGAKIDEQDEFGRTALTLALQLRRDGIAEHLLLSGAELTYTARNDYQLADVDQPMSDRLKTALRIRLLSSNLISLDANDARRAPHKSIDLFEANQKQGIADLRWQMRCLDCPVPVDSELWGDLATAGNPREAVRPECCKSTRKNTPETTTFTLSQLLIYKGLRRRVSATLQIPACNYSTDANPTCFPRVEVVNPNAGYHFPLQDRWGGPVDVPDMTMTVKQAGIPDRLVSAGATRIFDRSLGALTIELGPRESQLYDTSLTVRWKEGPQLGELKIEDGARTATYVAMARMRDRLATLEEAQVGESSLPEMKTLHTALHIASAKAVEARYDETAENNLSRLIPILVALDVRVVALHRALTADSSLTADEIDVQLAVLDDLLRGCGPADCAERRATRELLGRARATLSTSSSALSTLLGQFQTEVDRLSRDYQSLILEAAAYVDRATMATWLADATRNQIKSKLTARDVFIRDTAAAGKGKELRLLFGLPDPPR